MTTYNQYWRGDAPAVAQVNTITPASVTIGNTFTVTINGKSVTYTAAAATVADVVTGLTALLQACTYPEFEEVDWTANGTTDIVATAATPGVPFTNTSSAATGSGSSGCSLTTATTTASAGPADISTAANWSSGVLPGTGTNDTIDFTVSSNPALYGLGALASPSGSIAQCNIDMSFAGGSGSSAAAIGLPRNNSKGYVEYRPRYLTVPCPLFNVGNGSGAGAGRININAGSTQTVLNIFGTASNPLDTGLGVVQFLGTNTSNVVNINRGSLSAAVLETETAAIGTLNQGWQSNQPTDTTVILGSGVTLATVNKTGGQLTLYCSFTTLTQGTGNPGTTLLATGTPGSIYCYGGNVIYRTPQNYTLVHVGETGTVDFRQGTAAITGTNTTLDSGASFLDPGKLITFTNPILVTCRLEDVTLDLGNNFHAQRS